MHFLAAALFSPAQPSEREPAPPLAGPQTSLQTVVLSAARGLKPVSLPANEMECTQHADFGSNQNDQAEIEPGPDTVRNRLSADLDEKSYYSSNAQLARNPCFSGVK